MDSLFKFIRELIDIPSVTGNEGDLAVFVERSLRRRGFDVRLQEVQSGRSNVFASSGQPGVVLCTHLDTVPPFYKSSEDHDYIYGRGACDAKGCLAAMVEAAERLRAEGVDGVGLLFVVGEEADSIGAKTANRLRPGSTYILVGEPTENKMALGHKGVLFFRVKAEGRAVHSAYPHLGESAIEGLLDALEAIRRADWGRSERLGEATVNIGTVSGGVAANVVAAEAEAAVLIRVVGRVAEVEAQLESLLANKPVRYEIVNGNDAVTCETLPDFELTPVAFGTDIPSLTAFGKPLLLGPGSIHDAHTAQEKIGKREAARAVELYRRAATGLLGRVAT